MVTELPRVFFVCIGNAGRSQMAQAFYERRGGEARSAGSRPERDVVRWFSDASALTRYGIESVNYGTSSGLPDPVLGENLDIEGLVRVAQVYALVAARICGVEA